MGFLKNITRNRLKKVILSTDRYSLSSISQPIVPSVVLYLLFSEMYFYGPGIKINGNQEIKVK